MKKIAFILCLLMCACDKQTIDKHNGNELRALSYYKDSKTKLCFAAAHLGSQWAC